MAAVFPSIYYTLRRTNDVTFSEAGNGSRSFFLPKAKLNYCHENNFINRSCYQ